MDEMEQTIILKELLAKVQQAELLRRQRIEEARKRGEKYNVFDVLGVGTDEVRMHSAFLANLLDPEADHGCGTFFLRLFVHNLMERESFGNLSLDLEKVQVHTEFSIGNVDEDYQSGGRLDIIVATDTHAIIIENKIYALDQPKQIQRYCRYAKSHYGDNARVLYLTLDGQQPSEDSADKNLEEGKDYYAISYSKDIIEWLNLCAATAAFTPIIRETIGQYINLIKRLTSNDMKQEEIDSLLETLSQYPEATAAIFNSGFDTYIRYCFNTYAEPVFKEYAERNGLVYESVNMIGYGEKGFYFRKPDWRQWAVFVYAEKKSTYNDFCIGVSNFAPLENKIPLSKLDCLKESPNDNWPLGWSWLEKYCSWYGDTTIDIINGTFAKGIIRRVDEILKEIETKKLYLLL